MSKTVSARGRARTGYHPGFGDWGGGPQPVIGRHQRSRLNAKNQGRVPPVWMFANGKNKNSTLAAKRFNKTEYVMTWKLVNGVPKATGIRYNPGSMFATWYQHPSAETAHFVPSKGFYNFNTANVSRFAGPNTPHASGGEEAQEENAQEENAQEENAQEENAQEENAQEENAQE